MIQVTLGKVDWDRTLSSYLSLVTELNRKGLVDGGLRTAIFMIEFSYVSKMREYKIEPIYIAIWAVLILFSELIIHSLFSSKPPLKLDLDAGDVIALFALIMSTILVLRQNLSQKKKDEINDLKLVIDEYLKFTDGTVNSIQGDLQKELSLRNLNQSTMKLTDVHFIELTVILEALENTIQEVKKLEESTFLNRRLKLVLKDRFVSHFQGWNSLITQIVTKNIPGSDDLDKQLKELGSRMIGVNSFYAA